MKSKILILFKIVCTLFLIVYVAYQVDWTNWWRLLQEVNPVYYLSMVVLWPLSLYLMSLRWKIILKKFNFDLSIKLAFDLNWISSFYNNFLPSSVGGDSYKFYYLNKKEPKNKIILLSSIVVDRYIGLVGMLIFSFIFSIPFLSKIFDDSLLLFLWLGIFLGSVVSVTLLFHQRIIFLEKKCSRRWIQVIFDFVRQCLSLKDKGALLRSLFYSVIFLLITVLAYYLIFLSLNIQPSFFLLLFLIPLVNLTELIPVTINAIGLREGSAIFLFSKFGYVAEPVLTVYLMARIILLILSLSGGIRFLTWKRSV